MKTKWIKADPNRDHISQEDRQDAQSRGLTDEGFRRQLLQHFAENIVMKRPFVSDVASSSQSYRCIGFLDEQNHYQVILLGTQLAKGGEGAIYKARNLANGKIYAVKEIDAYEQPEVYVEPEYQALKKMHRAIGLVNIDRRQPYYMVMPFYEGKTLISELYTINPMFSRSDRRHFGAKKQLSDDEVLQHANALVKELLKMEEAGLVHRDVTPWNILLGNREISVVDYGGAVAQGSPRQASIGTLGYVPPEVDNPLLLAQNCMETSYDRFSLGIILAEMLTMYNFQHHRLRVHETIRSEGVQRQMTIDEIKAGMPDIFDPELVALESRKYQTLVAMINNLVQEDPKQRPDLHKLRYQLGSLSHKSRLSDIIHRTEDNPVKPFRP